MVQIDSARIAAVWLFLTAIFTATVVAWSYYEISYDNFRNRKIEEKATVLELTQAYMKAYLEVRNEHKNDDHLPVPATFRAHAFEDFNKQQLEHDHLTVHAVGMPGRSIATEPIDAHLTEVINHMSRQSLQQPWREFVGGWGVEMFRSVHPIIAKSEGCISCHNALQNEGPAWKLGDMMGVTVIDVPAAAHLKSLRKTAVLSGASVFAAILLMGFGINKIQHRIASVKLEANQAHEREAAAAKAREAAEELALVREQAEKQSRRLAEQLRSKNGELAHLNDTLEQRLSELHYTQNELINSSRMAQLGQLSAMVAHEIRNPLNAIRTSAFIIERKMEDTEVSAEKPMARIKNGVERCQSTITQLLDVVQSPAFVTQTRVFDNWMENVIRLHAERFSPQVTVECRFNLGGMETSFDPAQLQRAIINLLTNAEEALLGRADKPVENPTENPMILIETRRSQRGIEIDISDNGPGIPADKIEMVHQAMFTTKSFGIGLGMAVVKRIVHEHGGDLEIASNKHLPGATVTIWLPLQLKNAQHAA